MSSLIQKSMAPGTALMRRLRVSTKFGLIALLFLTPLALALAVFEEQLDRQQERADAALAGLTVVEALVPVMQAEQDLRDATDAWLRDGDDGLARLNEVRGTLAHATEGLVAVRNLAPDKTHSSLDTVAKLALDLRALTREQGADALQTRQAEALRQAARLLTDLLETSGLAVDEHLAVRYATDAGLGLGTSLIESLAAARTLSTASLQRKRASAAERATLHVAIGRIRILGEQVEATLARLTLHAPQMSEQIKALAQEMAQVYRYADLIERGVVNATDITLPAAPVASLGGKATKAAQNITLTMLGVVKGELAERSARESTAVDRIDSRSALRTVRGLSFIGSLRRHA